MELQAGRPSFKQSIRGADEPEPGDFTIGSRPSSNRNIKDQVDAHDAFTFTLKPIASLLGTRSAKALLNPLEHDHEGIHIRYLRPAFDQVPAHARREHRSQ